MAKMIQTPSKICEICGTEFSRKSTYPIKQYLLQRTCSGLCRSELLKRMGVGFKKGHPSYSEKGRFENGHIPDNKGKSGLQLAWNKGITGSIPWNKGKINIYSEETKQKIRDARSKQIIPSGKDNCHWKGGTSALRKLVQQTYLYKNWRTSVFKRDNWTCQIATCNQYGGKLHADHIKSYSKIIEENNITTVEEAKKCIELWDINNGRTLCVRCHMATDNYGGKSIKKIIN